MPLNPLSMLLLRRLRPVRHQLHHHRRRHVTVPTFPFSSLSSPQSQSPTSDSVPKPGSLSARMSFVFDQIDAIEKERAEKDQTLQRIRAWRESKRQPTTAETSPAESSVSVSSSEQGLESVESGKSLDDLRNDGSEGNLSLLNGKREVELVHPWPEWIGLMERLVQQNYFDHKRKDEDGMMENLGFNLSEVVEEDGFDFTRDFRTVQTAVLNFGRDRFDILRSLSRQDLQVLVGYGCPSTDKKAVFSAKLLRKLVHLDEGDVCSSCSLRSSCERAYLLTNKEDEARTIDVMRVLLTYGFDPVNGSVTNKPLLKMKSVKTVVRRLLHEVVKLSAVPIDPNLPPPVIKKPPPKVKQPPPPPKKRVGRDDIEMKKGDWLCPKCDFMNFAKNTICLQCDAKRPKRQLLPGEWECPQCNFLNYRRNMVCFHCEHKRPPDDFMESQVQERQRGPRRLEKVPDRREFSNAWNFDFDDNESDGADVATFEYADSQKMDEDFPLSKGRGREDGYSKGLYEKENSNTGPMKPGLGFNDFDDEDDDLDSYELDTQSGGQKPPRVNFSELEEESISEDEETTDRQASNFHAQNKPSSKSSRQPKSNHPPFSGSDNDIDFGSDDDLPIHPNWKSSHVTQFGQRSKRRGAMSFGSDDELSSDPDDVERDFSSQKKKGKKWSSSSSRREGNSDFEDESFSDLESSNNTPYASKGRLGNRRSQSNIRRGGNFDFVEDSDLESHANTRSSRGGFSKKGSERWSSRRRGNSDSEDEPFSDKRPFGKGGFRNKGGQHSRGNSHFDNKRNSRKERSSDFQNFRSSRREGSSKQRSGNQRGDSYLDDDRFRRPRVNVR